MSGMEEIERLLNENPEASAGYACTELHYGRLEWLAVHIRRCDYKISPIVARKLLTMIEKSDPHCYFELRATRRSDLAPAFQDPRLREMRNFEMATEVARQCKFKRGYILRACHEVGKSRGLSAKYVRNQVAPYRERALSVIVEEEMQAAYDRGEIDFLGRPIPE